MRWSTGEATVERLVKEALLLLPAPAISFFVQRPTGSSPLVIPTNASLSPNIFINDRAMVSWPPAGNVE